MDSGLDPSHIHLKPLFSMGAGMGQMLIAYVKDVFESHTYTVPRPLLDDSP